MSQGPPYNRTLRKGENDQSVPWYKRRDSYGEPLRTDEIGLNDPAGHQEFVDLVNKGTPYVDAGARDEAQLHADSLRGSNEMTRRTMEEIQRRLAERDARRR